MSVLASELCHTVPTPRCLFYRSTKSRLFSGIGLTVVMFIYKESSHYVFYV